MKILRFNSTWVWAARDLLRHPYETMLLAFALTLLIAITGAALLLVQALSFTATQILQAAPALVVRKISPGGWDILPAPESVQRARGVPGVVEARTRLWGTVAGPKGPVTVIAVDQSTAEFLSADQLSRLPKPGQAVIGQGVITDPGQRSVTLRGRRTMSFEIVQVLDPSSSMATQDIVLLDEADVRSLLAIPPGFASDLAIEVFHEEEEQALIADLAAAFPWPVRITTRSEALGSYTAGWARIGGIASLAALPALTALALIVAGTLRDRIGRRYEVGLLKALGWTSADVIRVQIYRSVLIGLFAAASGMLTAYLLVFWPNSLWLAFFLSGWETRSPTLYLDAAGTLLVLLQIVAIIIIPFLAATLWPALKLAAADPQDLIRSYEG